MSTYTRRSFLRGSAAAVGAAALPAHSLAAPATPGPTPLATSALDDLRARLHGTVMVPGDSGYLPASAAANGRYLDIRPMAVARCADEDDVVTCIAWCRENGIPPVARGGGHSYAGYSTTTGLLIDIRRLNQVKVDWQRQRVTCGGAALNSDFFIATENGPMFLPGGTCLGVGIGGLTLGGGIGYNTHWAGLTCDHLQASRIVTASGDMLDIDSTTHRDLFWACRGGAGGSFGINTAFTFDLVDVPREPVSWYRLDWQGAENAHAVLAAFDTLLRQAPAALNAVAMAEATDPAGGDPRQAIHVMSRGQFIGPVEELHDLIGPLLAIGKPTSETVTAMPFWDIQRMIATAEPESHSFGDISRYARDPLPDQAIGELVDLLAACPHRTADANGSIWNLGWVGGEVVDRFGRTDTAYVHRNVTSLLRPTTVWPNDAPPSVGDDLNAWTDAVIAAIAPHTPAESYQNFPNRSIAHWENLYYAENFPRLVDVKTAWDPDNLFTNPQSIPPR